MSKKCFLTLILLFGTVVVYAQLIMVSEGYTHTNPARDFGAREIVDRAKLFVTYEYNYVVDTVVKQKFNERMILEIGDDVNRFYSRNSEIRDSLAYNNTRDYYNNTGYAGGIANPKSLGINKSTTYCDIYTYPKLNERTISSRFMTVEYQYIEPIDKLDWNILPEIDTIAGYVCHKSETTFRGRKWYAWFSMEIPYNYGPWKLGGLPGLILKAEDAEGLHEWKAIGIEQSKNRHVYNYSGKIKASFPVFKYKVKKCNREDVAKLWERQWVAPLSMMFLGGGVPQVRIMSKNGSRKVNINMNDLPDVYYPKLELDL